MNSKDVVAVSDRMYQQLSKPVLMCCMMIGSDEPGFKFKDADLLGMPFQLIVGDKGLKNGQIEIKRRKTGERILVKLEDAVSEMLKLVNS